MLLFFVLVFWLASSLVAPHRFPNNKGTRTMKEMTDTSIERNFSLVWTSSEGTTRLTTESSLGLGPDD